MHPPDLLKLVNEQCGKGQFGTCGTRISWYDIKKFSEQFFDLRKRIPQIQKQRSLRYSADAPGVVQFRETSNPDSPYLSLSIAINGTDATLVDRICNPTQYGLKPLREFGIQEFGFSKTRKTYCDTILSKYGKQGDVINPNLFYSPPDLNSLGNLEWKLKINDI